MCSPDTDDGGSGRSCTCGVSYVAGLQSAALATRRRFLKWHGVMVLPQFSGVLETLPRPDGLRIENFPVTGWRYTRGRSRHAVCRHHTGNWWNHGDSHPEPPRCHRGALLIELWPRRARALLLYWPTGLRHSSSVKHTSLFRVKGASNHVRLEHHRLHPAAHKIQMSDDWRCGQPHYGGPQHCRPNLLNYSYTRSTFLRNCVKGRTSKLSDLATATTDLAGPHVVAVVYHFGIALMGTHRTRHPEATRSAR